MPERIIIGVLVVLVAAGLCVGETGPSFTTEDILNIWRDQEAKLKDLYVNFDLEETLTDDRGSVVASKRESITYMAKENRFRTRKQTFDPKNNGEVSADWEFSADGQREYYCDRPASYGTVKKSLPEQAGIRDSWVVHYLTCLQRMPRKPGNLGFECNLIGALEEDKAIQISQGTFDGRQVVVLIRPGFEKVYLDPKLNFAVLGGEAIGKLTFKYRNSDFVEVAEGVWMPKQTERSFRDTKTSQQVTRKTTVNSLKATCEYSDDDFRIKFDPGIRVRDIDLGTYITPSSADLDGFYLGQLLDMAEDRNSIDVYHVRQGADRSGAAEAKDAHMPLGDAANAPMSSGVGASTRVNPWQKTVTLVALGLAAALLAVLWRRQRKTPRTS
jgi:hypothetical protein